MLSTLESYLTGADLAEAALAQHTVHAKCFVCDWLSLQPLPLQVAARELRLINDALPIDAMQSNAFDSFV